MNYLEKYNLSTGKRCELKRIRNEWIPNYYILIFPKDLGEPGPKEISEMITIGMECAQNLANDYIKDKEAFTILYSGYSSRREKGWHIHIVLLGNRWRKAWLYLILSGKNLLQAFRLKRDDAPKH